MSIMVKKALLVVVVVVVVVVVAREKKRKCSFYTTQAFNELGAFHPGRNPSANLKLATQNCRFCTKTFQ
jgi:hypothetical protein